MAHDPVLAPQARMIDPRGMRFGAGVSAVLLVAAWIAGSPIGTAAVALIGLQLGLSSLFGTQHFLLSRPWKRIKSTLRLGPVELEHEYAPRFAQAMGATFLLLGALLLALALNPVGWLPVAAVVALQTLLAATGFCLGCRLYFLRWAVPALFARLARRTTRDLLPAGTPSIRFGD
jgi:hypothetical protein